MLKKLRSECLFFEKGDEMHVAEYLFCDMHFIICQWLLISMDDIHWNT